MLHDLLVSLGLRVRRLGNWALRPVEDPLMEERTLRFQAQVVAGLALTETLNVTLEKKGP